MKRNLNIFLLLFLLLLCLPATIAAAFSDVKSSDWFAADVGDMTGTSCPPRGRNMTSPSPASWR